MPSDEASKRKGNLLTRLFGTPTGLPGVRGGREKSGGGLFASLWTIPVLIIVVGCSCQLTGFGNFPVQPPIATPVLSGPLTPTVQPPTATPIVSGPVTPTVQPQPTASATQLPRPSATATQTPTGSPTAVASLPATAMLDSVCIFVHHQRFGDFVSFFDFAMWWSGVDFYYLELTIKEANNDAPIQLVLDPEDGSWRGKFGLNAAGTKQIVSLIAHFPDGSQLDLTADLIDHLGDDEFEVRHPQEDVLGC